jgi:DNA-directed RNA polymerase specialized sigma subunit
MTTKEYLNQISRLNRMINNKLVEIQQLRDLALGISSISTGERVQSTPDFDKIGSKMAKIDELEKNLDETIDKYVDLKNRIIGQIESMEDEITYNILFSRYIEKKQFELIAIDMGYSWRQIIRLHGNALRQFEEKFGNEYM